MSHLMPSFLFLTLLSAPLMAAQYRFVGQLEAVSRDGSGMSVKEFTLHGFQEPADSIKAFYLLEETRPALPWIERYGMISATDALLDPAGVALGYRHLDRNYVLPMALPYFKDFAMLEGGARWKNEQGEFQVTGEKMVNNHPCWEVKASTGIARHHQLFVRKSQPLIEAGVQTVFMGPGDRFRITFRQEPVEEESSNSDSEFVAARDALLKMQSLAKRDDYHRFQPLSTEQVQLLAASKDELMKLAKGTSLESLATEIGDDLTMLVSRQDRLGTLADSMLNRNVPKFTLKRLNSEDISSTSFSGKPVVLHFWDYANPTLEQPYGQVGYLDFINNRWADKGVLVYGVAINSELTDPETRGKGIRSIEQLKQFMKLSYEVTFDGGAVLNSFGNPTRLGEELPLWVVISPEGKVVHYQTGFYEVDNRVGLKLLDDAIAKLLK